jgi:hypothetical protein
MKNEFINVAKNPYVGMRNDLDGKGWYNYLPMDNLFNIGRTKPPAEIIDEPLKYSYGQRVKFYHVNRKEYCFGTVMYAMMAYFTEKDGFDGSYQTLYFVKPDFYGHNFPIK